MTPERFDFSRIEAPFRMQPGLARLPGRAPPTLSSPSSRHRREKIAVLSAFHAQALVSAARFDARPALDAIVREAGVDAAAIASTIAGDADAAAAIAAVPEASRAAARIALAFEEDFAVVDAATGTLPWLAVCLPSRWAPERKLGLAFADVHRPVADGERIVAAGDALVRLVSGGDRFERWVWTVSADPRLHQHPARGQTPWPHDDEADAAALAAMASFRHERQRFIPIEGRGQAVFTIRVDSEPLQDAVGTADAAHRLHDAIATMSPAVLAYKGLAPARDRLLRWLAGRRPSSPPSPASGRGQCD